MSFIRQSLYNIYQKPNTYLKFLLTIAPRQNVTYAKQQNFIQKRNFRLSTSTKQQLNYKICPAKLTDTPHIIELMEKYFIQGDPMIRSFNLPRNARDTLLRFITCSLYDDIDGGFTLVARNQTPKSYPPLYGVAICGISTLDSVSKASADLERLRHAKLRQLLRFWIYVAEKPCLWQKYCVNEVYEVAFITTHPLAKKHGLGTQLLKQSICNAKNLGLEILRVDCTSFYTALMCMKLNMSEVFKVYYDEYIDEVEGTRLNKLEHPHKSCVTYVARLKPRKNEQPKIEDTSKVSLTSSTSSKKHRPESAIERIARQLPPQKEPIIVFFVVQPKPEVLHLKPFSSPICVPYLFRYGHEPIPLKSFMLKKIMSVDTSTEIQRQLEKNEEVAKYKENINVSKILDIDKSLKNEIQPKTNSSYYLNVSPDALRSRKRLYLQSKLKSKLKCKASRVSEGMKKFLLESQQTSRYAEVKMPTEGLKPFALDKYSLPEFSRQHKLFNENSNKLVGPTKQNQNIYFDNDLFINERSDTLPKSKIQTLDTKLATVLETGKEYLQSRMATKHPGVPTLQLQKVGKVVFEPLKCMKIPEEFYGQRLKKYVPKLVEQPSISTQEVASVKPHAVQEATQSQTIENLNNMFEQLKSMSIPEEFFGKQLSSFGPKPNIETLDSVTVEPTTIGQQPEAQKVEESKIDEQKPESHNIVASNSILEPLKSMPIPEEFSGKGLNNFGPKPEQPEAQKVEKPQIVEQKPKSQKVEEPKSHNIAASKNGLEPLKSMPIPEEFTGKGLNNFGPKPEQPEAQKIEKPKIIEQKPAIQKVEKPKIVEQNPETQKVEKPKIVEQNPETQKVEEPKIVEQNPETQKVEEPKSHNIVASKNVLEPLKSMPIPEEFSGKGLNNFGPKPEQPEAQKVEKPQIVEQKPESQKVEEPKSHNIAASKNGLEPLKSMPIPEEFSGMELTNFGPKPEQPEAQKIESQKFEAPKNILEAIKNKQIPGKFSGKELGTFTSKTAGSETIINREQQASEESNEAEFMPHNLATFEYTSSNQKPTTEPMSNEDNIVDFYTSTFNMRYSSTEETKSRSMHLDIVENLDNFLNNISKQKSKIYTIADRTKNCGKNNDNMENMNTATSDKTKSTLCYQKAGKSLKKAELLNRSEKPIGLQPKTTSKTNQIVRTGKINIITSENSVSRTNYQTKPAFTQNHKQNVEAGNVSTLYHNMKPQLSKILRANHQKTKPARIFYTNKQKGKMSGVKCVGPTIRSSPEDFDEYESVYTIVPNVKTEIKTEKFSPTIEIPPTQSTSGSVKKDNETLKYDAMDTKAFTCGKNKDTQDLVFTTAQSSRSNATDQIIEVIRNFITANSKHSTSPRLSITLEKNTRKVVKIVKTVETIDEDAETPDELLPLKQSASMTVAPIVKQCDSITVEPIVKQSDENKSTSDTKSITLISPTENKKPIDYFSKIPTDITYYTEQILLDHQKKPKLSWKNSAQKNETEDKKMKKTHKIKRN